ncbi:MAG: hypothetical protein KF726_27405 [Anaerolineae bacterium]|nr:hypothetical protein [Anaerolineae bacterium]
MSLDQVLTLAPQIALALLGIGVLAFLISLRSFSVSRSPTFWRRRRAAGQRGWRLFLLSVFFFVLSGATCGIGSIGSRIVSQQFQETVVAVDYDAQTLVANYRALTETAASWTDTPAPLPSLTPTVNPTATLAAPTEDTSATAVALQQTLDSTFTTMISQTLTALPQTLTAVAISIAQQTPTVAPTEAATVEAVTVITDSPIPPSETVAPTDQPTLTPTTTATEADTLTPTPLPPSATIELSATPITPTITETPTITLTASETLTPTASETPTLTFTPTQTQTPTISPTATETLIPVAVAPIQTLSSSITPSADARLRITALTVEISNDFKPINPAQEFAAGIRRLYFFVEFDAMQPGVIWRRELRLNDEVILQGTYLWGQLITGTTFFYFGQPGGFPAGNYEIRLYLGAGDTPIDAAAFILK